MSLPRNPTVLIALVVALSLALGAGSMTPRTALAAGVNIDPSSCGGLAKPNCTGLPANVMIGANSCTVASSCGGLQDGIVIGSGSCDGTDACDLSGGSIGDNSCNGTDACEDNGYEGNGSVGANSCNGDYACQLNGLGGNGSVGEGSCNGNSACGKNGYEGYGSVGDSSCNSHGACYTNGYMGNGSVGNDSCNGNLACLENGFFIIGVIGNISCNQTGTYNANCQGEHEDVGNCMYNDVPTLCTQGSIEVRKVVVGNSSDRFDLKIDGIVEASAVGDGGTAGPVLVGPGSHYVGESAVYPASLSNYDQRVTCEAYNAIVGSQPQTIVPTTRGAATFSVAAGDVVTCTITNTKLTSSWWHTTR